MFLELAAGDRPTPGFVHHDARALPHIEIVCDIDDVGKYVKEGSCDQVRATHFLEHFSHRETVDKLTAWSYLLAPKGMIYIEVPNLMWQAQALVNGHDHEEIVRLMYGDQDYEGNSHFTGFTNETLTKSLIAAGFGQISIIDVGMVLCATAYKP